MWLQAGLFFIVLYQKRQVLGPVVLKVPWQVLVHVVLCYGDVKVGVQVARVLLKKTSRENSKYNVKWTVTVYSRNVFQVI